jgi:hypothetical protein
MDPKDFACSPKKILAELRYQPRTSFAPPPQSSPLGLQQKLVARILSLRLKAKNVYNIQENEPEF